MCFLSSVSPVVFFFIQPAISKGVLLKVYAC